MKATEKIQNFISEYRIKVNKLKERTAATNQQIEEIKLEARFIREKELPEASVKRVLEGDSALETKLKKKLEKLEAELAEKQEEEVILMATIQRYKFQSAGELKKLQPLFNDEMAIAKEKAYSRMMAKKREYVEVMKAESDVLHRYHNLDVQLQSIEIEAGLRKDVYNIFTVDSAPIQGHLNRHNGIYLAFTHEDVKKVLSNHKIDLNYLSKY
ncbi:hypothetical protein FIU87_05390 [Bacillus sp. THAF10]|uniref:hypothetical protein n=1 Tax=Bacillus sp. THAF10 TaxID=2587848 RepID=UPI001267D3CC|nr:hypothetical protein [Bacillus sp. THAF10]QFT88067.1 hypothetical protein FIU87_05390 [Bacillus sp. THAF10]